MDAYAEAYFVSDEDGKTIVLTVVTEKSTGSVTDETTGLVVLFAVLELQVCIRYSKMEIKKLITMG